MQIVKKAKKLALITIIPVSFIVVNSLSAGFADYLLFYYGLPQALLWVIYFPMSEEVFKFLSLKAFGRFCFPIIVIFGILEICTKLINNTMFYSDKFVFEVLSADLFVFLNAFLFHLGSAYVYFSAYRLLFSPLVTVIFMIFVHSTLNLLYETDLKIFHVIIASAICSAVPFAYAHRIRLKKVAFSKLLLEPFSSK